MRISIDLAGPYPLTRKAVDQHITESRPGIFISGNVDGDDDIIPEYIGRSDYSVAEAVRGCIGRHSHFLFSYADSPAHAFILECDLFHRLPLTGRQPHPALPERLRVCCPLCGFHEN